MVTVSVGSIKVCIVVSVVESKRSFGQKYPDQLIWYQRNIVGRRDILWLSAWNLLLSFIQACFTFWNHYYCQEAWYCKGAKGRPATGYLEEHLRYRRKRVIAMNEPEKGKKKDELPKEGPMLGLYFSLFYRSITSIR